VTIEAYRQTKSGGGKLKLKALARLAEGGPDAGFEAATLLREAARAEERALRLLATTDGETRLGAAVERCGCLVEARAPTAAAVAWGDVLVAGDDLPQDIVRAFRAKLDPAYEALQRAYRKAIAAAPTLAAVSFLWPATADKAKARRELDRLLKEFPGEFELWYLRYQAGLFERDYAAAWKALQKARALEPTNQFAIGAEMVLVPRVLKLAQAEARLDAAYGALRGMGAQLDADACLCFAVASFQIAPSSEHARRHHERALEMAELGASALLDTTHAKPDLRIVRALASDLLAGRTPTLDAFYRAGRGELVARAQAKDRKDPVRILIGAHDRSLEPLPRAA
jgi:hypothetical protein